MGKIIDGILFRPGGDRAKASEMFHYCRHVLLAKHMEAVGLSDVQDHSSVYRDPEGNWVVKISTHGDEYPKIECTVPFKSTEEKEKEKKQSRSQYLVYLLVNGKKHFILNSEGAGGLINEVLEVETEVIGTDLTVIDVGVDRYVFDAKDPGGWKNNEKMGSEDEPFRDHLRCAKHADEEYWVLTWEDFRYPKVWKLIPDGAYFINPQGGISSYDCWIHASAPSMPKIGPLWSGQTTTDASFAESFSAKALQGIVAWDGGETFSYLRSGSTPTLSTVNFMKLQVSNIQTEFDITYGYQGGGEYYAGRVESSINQPGDWNSKGRVLADRPGADINYDPIGNCHCRTFITNVTHSVDHYEDVVWTIDANGNETYPWVSYTTVYDLTTKIVTWDQLTEYVYNTGMAAADGTSNCILMPEVFQLGYKNAAVGHTFSTYMAIGGSAGHVAKIDASTEIEPESISENAQRRHSTYNPKTGKWVELYDFPFWDKTWNHIDGQYFWKRGTGYYKDGYQTSVHGPMAWLYGAGVTSPDNYGFKSSYFTEDRYVSMTYVKTKGEGVTPALFINKRNAIIIANVVTEQKGIFSDTCTQSLPRNETHELGDSWVVTEDIDPADMVLKVDCTTATRTIPGYPAYFIRDAAAEHIDWDGVDRTSEQIPLVPQKATLWSAMRDGSPPLGGVGQTAEANPGSNGRDLIVPCILDVDKQLYEGDNGYGSERSEKTKMLIGGELITTDEVLTEDDFMYYDFSLLSTPIETPFDPLMEIIAIRWFRDPEENPLYEANLILAAERLADMGKEPEEPEEPLEEGEQERFWRVWMNGIEISKDLEDLGIDLCGLSQIGVPPTLEPLYKLGAWKDGY